MVISPLRDQIDHLFDVPGGEEMPEPVYPGKMLHFRFKMLDNVPERVIDGDLVGFGQFSNLLLMLIRDDGPIFVH
jgi:hypothetical protein